MQFDYSAVLTPALAGLLAIYIFSKWFGATTHKLKHIPTAGSSGIIFSYLDALRFLRHGHEMIQEGCTKYLGSTFKVASLGGWIVLVSEPQMLDDIRRATADQMSFVEAVDDVIQIDYTLGRPIRVDDYHLEIIRTPLTRNIGARFSDIKDEIDASFRELIPVEEHKWTSVPALTTIIRIICRTTNRFFVGLPLCRNPGFIELSEQFTYRVFVGAQIINMFPRIFRAIVGRLVTKVSGSAKRALHYIQPLIETQLEQERLNGPDWPDKPNNLISWLLGKPEDRKRTITDLVLRFLFLNFASMNTTSNAFTHVLYDLAMHPEYVGPMREEVEAIVEDEGWTQSAFRKMYKLDSFIKESQRAKMDALIATRKLMRDFTFSNGIHLPAGTVVAVATMAIHMNEENYENPNEFQGFRFSDMRNKEVKNQSLVSLTPEFLMFGIGKHACPGRFLAAQSLRSMLAYVLLNYDVKLAQDGHQPESLWFEGRQSANRTAEVMFRKRSA